MGYWIARSFWGRGYATEACAALIDIAKTIGLTSLEGSHFLDNPASARVLEKLGFEALGIVAPRMSCARGEEVSARLMRLQLVSYEFGDAEEDEPLAA
jgi:RimJ/RimL family protein N-acetyltransferase